MYLNEQSRGGVQLLIIAGFPRERLVNLEYVLTLNFSMFILEIY